MRTTAPELDGPFADPLGQRPSHIRYEVMAAVTLMSLLLYLDRFCIGIAADRITKDLNLSRLEMAGVFSAFFLSYALAQVPTGWLGDRLGARVMLAGSVLVWSLLTGAMGLVEGLASLIVLRLLLGVSQAGAYPIAARVNSLWVPYTRRALANGLVTMGGRGGGALAPVLTANLMVLFLGDWRPVFLMYGGLGVAWAVYFYVAFRDTPAEQRRCNAAEQALILRDRPSEVTDPAKAAPLSWSLALRSSGLWLQCFGQVASNIAWLFLGTWLPTYLMTEYRLPLAITGFLASLPLLGGMFGCLLGGILTDRLTRRVGIRWGRSGMGMASKGLAAVFMLASVLADEPYLATAALVVASFTNDLGLSATWAYFQDTGGKHVGPLLGFANMFGNFGAMASPVLLALIQRAWGWPAALYTCSALFVVCGVSWLWIDARVPIVPLGLADVRERFGEPDA